MACPETRVGPGWEAQFGVNHMGHFVLTKELMPLLEKSQGARVVCLTSTGHKISNIRWDDIQFNSDAYDKWAAYGQSKTANALFANALSRRLKDKGGLAFSVHPGGIFTPLQRPSTQRRNGSTGLDQRRRESDRTGQAGLQDARTGLFNDLVGSHIAIARRKSWCIL